MGLRIPSSFLLDPALANGLNCKPGGIVGNANAYPALILCHIIHAIRNGMALFLIDKIVNSYFFWFPFEMPLSSAIFEISD
jgi:hypothetical protein